MSLPLVELPGDLDGRNVLVVPRGTDVVVLATAWFPDAAWTREPVSAERGREGPPDDRRAVPRHLVRSSPSPRPGCCG